MSPNGPIPPPAKSPASDPATDPVAGVAAGSPGPATARPVATGADPALGTWEGAAFMATGAALVLHILVDLPLWLSVATTLASATCVLFLAARRHPEGVAAGRRLVGVGFRSAVVALLAYDLTRLVLVTVLDFEVGPFDAFKHFGAGLLGTEGSPPTTITWVVGAAFHVTNAVTFGIAYTIVAGRRGVVAGIAFGLGLEVIMLGLYPAWLQIPNLREFTSMSMVGHVAYGATLGHLARRGLTRRGLVPLGPAARRAGPATDQVEG